MAASASTNQVPSEGVGENDSSYCELVTTVRYDKLHPVYDGVPVAGSELHVHPCSDAMPVFESVFTPRGVANGVRLDDLTLKYEVPTML